MPPRLLPPRFVVSAPQCRAGCVDSRAASHEKDACTYRVAWAINPHMRVGSCEPERALRQHCTFVRLLQRLGAAVDRVPFVHGAYDSVFVKDNALLLRRHGRDHALLSHPRHPERRGEPAARAHVLGRRGFVVHSAPRAAFEGGDVVMLPAGSGPVAFVGTGFRSDRAALPEVERFLGGEAVPLTLRDPHLYHLDMALSWLSDGTVVLCEEAFDAASLRTLARHTYGGAVITVPVADARRFAINLVQVGRAVVLGGHSPALVGALAARGYDVLTPALDEFHRAGGSAACLVARVHPYEAVAVRTSSAMRSTAA